MSETKRSPALIKAQRKYDAKRKQKSIWFDTAAEADLLAIADKMPNFSAWVKEGLKKELLKNNEQQKT